MIEDFSIRVDGHLRVFDDTGAIHVNKHNAVHPQNLARIFARALAHENNSWIGSIAFGNGGTTIGLTQQIEYNVVNDGQPPDTHTWDSTLYNETYREIIDEGDTGSPNALLGTDPGSAGVSGTRPGGGSVPGSDPASVPNVSGPGVISAELGLTSQVIITCVLNANEPIGQFLTDTGSVLENPESSFMFDEIALFTSGAPLVATSGSHDIDIGNKTAFDDSGLLLNANYKFNIAVDGSAPVVISFTTPVAGGTGPGGAILYGDIVKALNHGAASWSITRDAVAITPGTSAITGASVNINNDGSFDAQVPAAETYGFLRFMSDSTGVNSDVVVTAGASNDMFAALNPPSGGTINPAVSGQTAGLQNYPTNPALEAQRMLTHVIFSPVLKAANRTLTVQYILTISVPRTA